MIYLVKFPTPLKRKSVRICSVKVLEPLPFCSDDSENNTINHIVTGYSTNDPVIAIKYLRTKSGPPAHTHTHTSRIEVEFLMNSLVTSDF